LTFGFEHDSFGSHRVEDLADHPIRVTDRIWGRGGRPSESIDSCVLDTWTSRTASAATS
jgi:hypothetical protein